MRARLIEALHSAVGAEQVLRRARAEAISLQGVTSREQVEIAMRIGILDPDTSKELLRAIDLTVKPLNGMIRRIDRTLPSAVSR